MAVSSYKQRTQSKNLQLVQQLITQITGFDRANQNFRIAEDFAMHSFSNHTFLDTNESQLQRVFTNTCEKLFMHNQTELADRLAYLNQKFRQMPLQQEGISASHD
jgi:hypothetical protein